MELHETTAVNLLHVQTQVLESTPVPVMKDTLGMEKLAKVKNRNFCHADCVQSHWPGSFLPHFKIFK